ncbi:translesion error-prone DNA polymerase V autoproteolytic subunit [bacterium]|nr:translesion error-prone DNA polymerase V autoproteolytic subunit [bacterium]NCQ55934.1 translesion error-prone DNA polymerase V autoproteolytic subunit [Candidatus Parcubacteria bacterium]NCS67959.1 translesion error-prone DNA polymerase V autoproteolytic subunit [Candidatus Peregrinibacteria bacterium]NCS96853.1 translesion error-prone DNA polymerase V autoproteolytic subunit [bacterium]
MKVLDIKACEATTSLALPLFSDRVKAGFPSPADDHLQRRLDLNEELIAHPAATFLVRVTGDSMQEAGIFDNDTLVVDRSLNPVNKSVVVALLNGEFTVKYFSKIGSEIYLKPANKNYEPIKIKPSDDFEVWGVVTNAIHHFNAA